MHNKVSDAEGHQYQQGEEQGRGRSKVGEVGLDVGCRGGQDGRGVSPPQEALVPMHP